MGKADWTMNLNLDQIKDVFAFWRWPAKVRSLSAELTALKAEHEALKAEHQKVVTGQVALLAWVKTTHRLHRAPEGIRALIQEGKRIIP